MSRERTPRPPTGLALPVQSETLSILASDEAWEEEFEEDTEGSFAPLPEQGSDESRIPVLVR